MLILQLICGEVTASLDAESTRNTEIKLEVSLISIKDTPLRMFPYYVCIGSHAFAMFAHEKILRVRKDIDDPLPNILHNVIWMPAFALLCIQLNYVVVFGPFISA